MKINYLKLLREAGIAPEAFLQGLFDAAEKIFAPKPETEFWIVRYDLSKVASVHKLWESKEARKEIFPFANRRAAEEYLKTFVGNSSSFIYDIEEAEQPEIKEEETPAPSPEGWELDPAEINRRFESMRKDFYAEFLAGWKGVAPTVEHLLGAQQEFERISASLYDIIKDKMRGEAKEKTKAQN